MSTRGCIARLTSKPGKKIHFKGVYHHWDSYPEALGCTLFDAYKNRFKSDINAMLKYFIDEHPAGWSTINADEECYCHGGRAEKGWVVTEKNASRSGCEYVYAFSGKTMVILSSYCEDGAKMVGMFGCGDPKAKWKVIGIVDLDGNEPDWENKLVTNQGKVGELA